MAFKLFLSYARGDDEPFVARLHSDLTAAGFDVWFDRVSLPSRQLTFHQEIADAIRARDKVVLVVGPKAALSDYVRQEWRWALELDKPVIPILRQGDFTHVPGEVSLLHCDDFRDDARYPAQLAKLIENLRRPAPPLGALYGVPNLPPYFLGRPELLRRVKDALLVDLQKPVVISGAASRVGMQGMGGIGKSVLAAALARDPDVRRSYPDGIIWVAVGQQPDRVRLLRDVARHMGSQEPFQTEVQGQGVLRQLLAQKAVLLVLDDVWQAADAQAFDVLGPRCRALVTTRDAGILRSVGGQRVPVSLFTETEALQLLADAVGVERAALPREAQEVVSQCGCLPLAVALCGGMAKAGHSWRDIVGALREADLEWAENREGANEQHRTIWNAMKASYDALPDNEKPRFAELAVFATDRTVPEAAVHTLWKHTSQLTDRNCTKLLINLAERSLIQLDQKAAQPGEAVERRFRLHDLVYDFATRLGGDPKNLHKTLLDAYLKQCPNGWHTGPNDDYFFQYLCGHLLAAGETNAAVTLLTHLPWTEAKCKAGLVFDLQSDYRDVIGTLPEAQAELADEQRRQERATKWTQEIIEYARQWNDRLERQARGEIITEPGPTLPEIVSSIEPWSNERIDVECTRGIADPTRMDLLRVFAGFVQSECYPLLEHGTRPGFVVQHAFNAVPAGPVHDEAGRLRSAMHEPLLFRVWPANAAYNPHPALLRTLTGHSGGVNSVSVTPDGRRAVSGSADKMLRVWNLESGACLHTLKGHSEPVWCVDITPDGRRAVSGSSDKTLRVWDMGSSIGVVVSTLTGHSDNVNSVSVTPDGRRAVSGSADTTLRVWDLESGTCQHTFNDHGDIVSCVGITTDGRRVVSGSGGIVSNDYTLRVWDLERGVCLRTLDGHSSYISSVIVTPAGQRAVSGSSDNTLRVWNLESGACLRTLKGRSYRVSNVSVTPDGRRAVSKSPDDLLRVWDLESGVCLRTIVWELKRPNLRFINIFECLSITPDGRRAVSGSSDDTLRVLDLESGACLRILESHDVYSVSLTPDGQRAVSGSFDNTLRVWALESGACLHILEGHRAGVNCITVTPNSQRAVSGSFDNTLRIWDLESGTCLRILEGHRAGVKSVSLTPDGQRAVSGSEDGTLRVWDLESGVCLHTLEGHSSSVHYVNVTPNGRRAVSGSSDKTLRVWDLKSWMCLHTLNSHSDRINNMSLTPHGRRAVSGSEDNTLRVWDFENRACSVGEDNTLRVWDLESGVCLAVVVGNAPWSVDAYSTALNRLVAGTSTGEVAFFDLANFE